MAKELVYGHVRGPGKGKEHPVAADQYFLRQGGKFVYFDSAGQVTLVPESQTTIGGWAVPPKDTSLKNCWKSSATAGEDKLFVITGFEDRFLMPWDDDTASLSATYIGKGVCASINNATYAAIQRAKYKATAASCMFFIEEIDTTNRTVTVGLKPSVLQSA